jgi:hypothetical protein
MTLLARLLPREPIESPPAVITVDFGYRRPRTPVLSTGSIENIIDVMPTGAESQRLVAPDAKRNFSRGGK